MSEVEQRIQKLVTLKAINICPNQTSRSRHRGHHVLPLSQAQEPLVGDFCRAVVVGKDEGKKELILHLTYLVEQDYHLYINHLKCKGCIRDYDLKEEYSIFTYLGTFKQITLGTEILAQVRNITTREDKKCYEMTLKCKKTAKNQLLEPRVTKDQVDVSERDWKIYNKYGCFSGTFLAQYDQNFANPGMLHRYCKDLRLKENDSLSQESLIPHLQGLSLDYERVRLVQEKQWADSHFMEGLQCLKANNPDLALEHLTLAKNFDKKNSKIYVARGCALANMNIHNEGLKDIKEALRLSPDNKEALEYQERIRKEIRAKERRESVELEQVEEGTTKIRVTNAMELVKKK